MQRPSTMGMSFCIHTHKQLLISYWVLVQLTVVNEGICELKKSSRIVAGEIEKLDKDDDGTRTVSSFASMVLESQKKMCAAINELQVFHVIITSWLQKAVWMQRMPCTHWKTRSHRIQQQICGLQRFGDDSRFTALRFWSTCDTFGICFSSLQNLPSDNMHLFIILSSGLINLLECLELQTDHYACTISSRHAAHITLYHATLFPFLRPGFRVPPYPKSLLQNLITTLLLPS